MRSIRATALLAFAALLAPRVLEACSCGSPGPGLEKSIRHAAAIFLGKAVKIEWVGDGFDEIRSHPGLLPVSRAVTFDVDTQWKGEPAQSITIHTGSGGGDCGSRFEVGQDYLVYAGASERPSGTVLTTSICHRGFAASRNDPRTRYEMEELDQALLGRDVPDAATARARAEIRELHDAYRRTVLRLGWAVSARSIDIDPDRPHPMSPVTPEPSPTAEQVLPFLCDDLFAHWGGLRDLALRASKEELLAGSLFDAIEVLLLRRRIDGKVLAAMTPAELVAHLYEEGWEPNRYALLLELGRFGATGEEVYVDGVRGTRFLESEYRILESHFRFEQIPGGWCFDAVWNPARAEAGQSLRYAAAQLGRPLDEYVLERVQSQLDQEGYRRRWQSWRPATSADPSLWYPLVPSPEADECADRGRCGSERAAAAASTTRPIWSGDRSYPAVAAAAHAAGAGRGRLVRRARHSWRATVDPDPATATTVSLTRAASMNRDSHLRRLAAADDWDIVVVGGGATGLGVAVDAAARGYRTVVLEQSDFAKGTSSRSTKLIHGGVRYLRQGNVSLVLEALRERGLLRRNAPHLVHDIPFVVPNYDWWEAPFYGIGLRLYDLLAGKHGFGASRVLSKAETLERLPTIETEGLRGGVLYFDGQFDDARLAMTLALTAADLGAVVLNGMPVHGLVKEDGILRGVNARDAESGRDLVVRAKVVVNATGPWSDSLRAVDDASATPILRRSQGVHIVLDRRFLPGDSAIMVPHTDDGRVLFAIPWHERIVVGTTDTPVPDAPLEPRPLDEELDFLLVHAARYLREDPSPADVLSTFAGIRPLVGNATDARTAAISRDHTLLISSSGLLTITGGKWTTYRKMAEDTVDHAAVLGGLPERACPTEELALHGHHGGSERLAHLAPYGADAEGVRALGVREPALAEPLHPRLPYLAAEVAWAAREEMARTVEDVLARRTRALLLDARASIEAAPRVAELLAAELGRDAAWRDEQTRSYTAVARGYLIESLPSATAE